MVIEIPNSLNGKTFYGVILPSIYKSIIQGDYLIDFDMHRTELANPEGLVNLMAAACMIRSKSGHVPQLYLPESSNLFEYMLGADFFRQAVVPGCEALAFNSFLDFRFKNKDRRYNSFPPKFFGVFTHSDEGTTFNGHVANIKKLVDEIARECQIPYGYCFMLAEVLKQIIRNSLEHNMGYRGALAYYMIQKTPYNTIEFVCSDIGQGYLERMKEMLRENDPQARLKYGHLEQKLNSRDLLFKDHVDNPNRLAIINAVNYRMDSKIPGLHTIKEFVLEFNGLFSIHSGNYSVSYSNGNENPMILFHDNSYFSGAHLKMVINIPEKLTE